MAGVGVEPPAPPAEAAAGAGLTPRRLRLRPSRVSAKRSWPPGCGRLPAPPPAEKGADGGASTVLGGRAGEEKGCGGRSEVAVNGDSVTGMGNRTGGKENGIAAAGSTPKLWLESSLNPPPKNRAVSAVRKFPPGCGRSPASTTGSGDEGLPSEATPVNNNNGDALVAGPVLGDSASPTLALEGSSDKRAVDDGHSSKAHSRVQVWDDFASTKQPDGDQQNVVAEATPRNASDGKMKGKLSAHKGKQLAQQVVDDDKVKNKLDGSLQRSNVRTSLSKTKAKRLGRDKMNAGLLLGNAESSAGGKLQSGTLLSAKKEAVCSTMNTKQKKFACKLKGDGIVKGKLHLSAGKPNLGKHGATDQIEAPSSQIIVHALRAPDNCPWTRGRKYIASSSKSLVPRNKLMGKDAKDQGSKGR